jgi:hypothetical protein
MNTTLEAPAAAEEFNFDDITIATAPRDIPALEDIILPGEAATPRPVVSKKTSEDILAKAWVLSVSSGKLGIRRTLRKDQIDVDADKELIAASKKLIDSKEYDAIAKLDGEIRQWLYSQTLRTSWLKDGMYLAPIVSVEAIDEQLQAYQRRREELVNAFMATYAAAREDAALRLRGVFADADYPNTADARRTFYFDWEFVRISTPNDAENVNPELLKRESAKLNAKLNTAAEEITFALRESLKQLVSNLAERLTGERENGKPKIFRDSAITNITDFLDAFSARNLCNDVELEKIAAQARDILKGVTPEDLRKQEPLREVVARQMAQISATLETMTQDAPTRAFNFEE